MNALSLNHAPRPSPERPLDEDLRNYLGTNRDIVTKMCEPVGLDYLGALSTRSDAPIERVCFDCVRATSADPTQVSGEILDQLAKASKYRPEC